MAYRSLMAQRSSAVLVRVFVPRYLDFSTAALFEEPRTQQEAQRRPVFGRICSGHPVMGDRIPTAF